MPVGCWLNHLIVRKSALRRALETAVSKGQTETIHFLQAILDRQHQDDHLVALEDMGGDDFFHSSLIEAGLVNDDGDDCVDFYSPSVGCPRATWLEGAQIRNIQRSPNEKPLTRWTAYRLVGDTNTEVVLEDEGDERVFHPEGFPPHAIPVDPSLWDAETWALIPDADGRWNKWRPRHSS